jgi:hypothetical protein
MDPMTASALIGAGSQLLGRTLSAPPAGPSTALGSSGGSNGSGGGLDFSGFTVALNGSTANGASHPTSATSGFAVTPMVLLIGGVIAIAMIRAWKK